MTALSIALIALGLVLVCGGLIFQRRYSEEPDAEGQDETRNEHREDASDAEDEKGPQTSNGLSNR